MRKLILLLILVSCGTEPEEPFRLDLKTGVEKASNIYWLYAEATPNKDIYIEGISGGAVTELDVLRRKNTVFIIELDMSLSNDFEGAYDITLYGTVDGKKITYETWVSP